MCVCVSGAWGEQTQNGLYTVVHTLETSIHLAEEQEIRIK